LGRALINRRKRGEMGNDAWAELNDRVARAPLFPRPFSWAGCAFRVVVGVAVFAALLALHPHAIDVSAM
jgi:hypothetical protein